MSDRCRNCILGSCDNCTRTMTGCDPCCYDPFGTREEEEASKVSLCSDCVYFDEYGWDAGHTGRPLPDPVPMSLLAGKTVSEDERTHECEGHFAYSPCDGCGEKLAGQRYCYLLDQ